MHRRIAKIMKGISSKGKNMVKESTTSVMAISSAGDLKMTK